MPEQHRTQAKSKKEDQPKQDIRIVLTRIVLEEMANFFQMIVWGDYYREGKRRRPKSYRRRNRSLQS